MNIKRGDDYKNDDAVTFKSGVHKKIDHSRDEEKILKGNQQRKKRKDYRRYIQVPMLPVCECQLIKDHESVTNLRLGFIINTISGWLCSMSVCESGSLKRIS